MANILAAQKKATININISANLANLKSSQPIGIFDSGIGGLTVTKAVVEQLPHEQIIYFGDTAHLPYGDKSADTIRNYSLKITEMLLAKGCKMILIACNSISAAAYDAIKDYVGDRALLVNVIDPVVNYLVEHCQNQKVGLIGTRQTIKSNVYQKKIEALAEKAGIKKGNNDITLRSLATPLLVPIIEEGFFNHELIDVALKEYLARDVLQDIDVLVLGCTHYPIIKQNIIDYYRSARQEEVNVIDASNIVANEVKRQLLQSGLLSMNANVGKKAEARKFYVSDYTDAFAAQAKMFFGENMQLQRYPLWDNKI